MHASAKQNRKSRKDAHVPEPMFPPTTPPPPNAATASQQQDRPHHSQRVPQPSLKALEHIANRDDM